MAQHDAGELWHGFALRRSNAAILAVSGQLHRVRGDVDGAPRVPRSMTRESVPVWRDRWKARSWLCRCWKVVLATRRMVFCVTCITHLQQAVSAGLTDSLRWLAMLAWCQRHSRNCSVSVIWLITKPPSCAVCQQHLGKGGIAQLVAQS